MKRFFLFINLLSSILISYAQPGTLDQSFGSNGITFTDLGTFSNTIYKDSACKILPKGDGTFYLALQVNNQTVLSHILSNGTVNSSFGTNGYSVSVGLTPASAALQPDGKIVIAGTCNKNFAVTRFNADGTLDKSFGNSGKQTTKITGTDYAKAVSIQKDNGKIFVAGQAYSFYTAYDFALVCYNPDGQPDNTFGRNGIVTTDLNFSMFNRDYAYCMALQPDGKILVAGEGTIGAGSYDFAIVRYNNDGTLDNSFSNDGKQYTKIKGSGYASSIAIQDNGKIVVAGPEDYDIALVRYNPDGSLDNNFSNDGIQLNDLGFTDAGYSVMIDSDGRLLVAGTSGGNFVIVRYLQDGTVDNSFSEDGKETVDFNRIDEANSIALEADGKIVLAGNSYTQTKFGTSYLVGTREYALVRFLPDGSLDNTFSDDGKINNYDHLGITSYNAIAVQSDGKVVVAGNNEDDFVVARYNTNGTLDNSFGQSGKLITDFSGLQDAAHAVAIQPDGKILVSGTAITIMNGINTIYKNSFALVRYNADGSLDNTFGVNGKVTTDFLHIHNDIANCIALQNDGKIVLAGSAETYNWIPVLNKDFAIARYNTDGSLDNTFSGDGLQITEFTAANEVDETAYAVAIQADGKIVLAGSTEATLGPPSSVLDFQLARYNTDGSLDNSFGTNGGQMIDFTGIDIASDMSIQPDGKIVVGGLTIYQTATSGSSASGTDFALARINTDGSLDNTFGVSGRQTMNLEGEDVINCLAVQPDGKILVAGYSRVSTTAIDWKMALARYNVDGTIDPAFGSNGVQLTDASGGRDEIESITIYNNKLYAAGTSENPGTVGMVAIYKLKETPPLPVTWLHFTGQQHGKEVLLHWATATESNSKEFIIERSLDGDLFFSIGTLPAAGSVNQTSNYQFIDKEIALNNVKILYYRLRQLDIDGRFTYSKVIAISMRKTNSGTFVNAYPNPLTKQTTLQVIAEKPTGQINMVELYSIDGKLLYQRKLSYRGSATILLDDLPELEAGIYMLRTVVDNKWYEVKMVKQ